MNSETRHTTTEIQKVHSVLTPSELATLLGPRAAQAIELCPVVTQKSASRWNLFADELARGLTTRLRPLIRAAVRVTFSGSHMITAETLTTSRENREVIYLRQSDRSIEPIAVSLSVKLVSLFVDRLLGGRTASDSYETDLHRPLTEVDHRLAARLSDVVVSAISDQFERTSPLKLSGLPSNASSLVDAWLPDCSLLRLSFDLRFVQGGGTLDVLFPAEIAESIADQPESVDSEMASLDAPRTQYQPALHTGSVVFAQLNQTSLSRDEVQCLAVGDVLLFTTDPNQKVIVSVDGRPGFEGIAGTINGHKAIRLTRTIALNVS